MYKRIPHNYILAAPDAYDKSKASGVLHMAPMH